jgi:hypothetical protein
MKLAVASAFVALVALLVSVPVSAEEAKSGFYTKVGDQYVKLHFDSYEAHIDNFGRLIHQDGVTSVNAEIAGAASTTRLASGAELYMFGQQAELMRLVKVESKKDKRKFPVNRFVSSPYGGVAPSGLTENMIAFRRVPCEGGFQLVPLQPLPPGEYVFLNIMATTQMINAKQKGAVFDFGVD